MEDTHSSSQSLWLQLPPEAQLHILSFLPPTDRALSGRLVSPDAAAELSKDPTCTASLAQPLPPHAAPWAAAAANPHRAKQLRQLPFWHKLQLLCAAAATGCQANLEVTLALLQPSIFPELLQQSPEVDPTAAPRVSAPMPLWLDRYADPRDRFAYCDVGVAAVKAGHPQLLRWLLHHCPGAVDSRRVLEAAAQHCNLEGLQVAYAALQSHISSGSSSGGTSLSRGLGGRRGGNRLPLSQGMLDAAASSPTPDALGKLEWLLSVGGSDCSISTSTAAAAARSGGLRERGCPVNGIKVLHAALEHADLAVTQWLVQEAKCRLPARSGQRGRWKTLLVAAAKSPDGVPKLQWLQERGAPPLDGGNERDDLPWCVLRAAAEAGRVEALQHILSVVPRELHLAGPELACCALSSGSVPLMQYLRQAGCTARCAAYEVAADAVADKGYLPGCDNLAIFRWLVQEAQAPESDCSHPVTLLQRWPNDTPAHSRALLEVVQLLLGEAGCRRWTGEFMLTTAARRGDLALVQYLLQHQPGYQPGWWVLVAAAEGGCEALLEWLVERHPGSLECAGPGVSPYAAAAANGDLGTLTALRRLGVPWGAGDVVAQAVRRASGASALRWLEEQGAPAGGA